MLLGSMITKATMKIMYIIVSKSNKNSGDFEISSLLTLLFRVLRLISPKASSKGNLFLQITCEKNTPYIIQRIKQPYIQQFPPKHMSINLLRKMAMVRTELCLITSELQTKQIKMSVPIMAIKLMKPIMDSSNCHQMTNA